MTGRHRNPLSRLLPPTVHTPPLVGFRQCHCGARGRAQEPNTRTCTRRTQPTTASCPPFTSVPGGLFCVGTSIPTGPALHLTPPAGSAPAAGARQLAGSTLDDLASFFQQLLPSHFFASSLLFFLPLSFVISQSQHHRHDATTPDIGSNLLRAVLCRKLDPAGHVSAAPDALQADQSVCLCRCHHHCRAFKDRRRGRRAHLHP